MKKVKRFINIFGSKIQSISKYPPPKYNKIYEVFAGGGAYSLMYHDRDVLLIDKNELITNAWDYIIKATPEEVMKLPLLEKDQLVSDLNCSEGGKLVISWCCNQLPHPAKKLSTWGLYHNARGAACYWGETRRKQMAEIASKVKHWKVKLGDYKDCPDDKATVFCDPPYQGMKVYKHDNLDYQEYAKWVKSRKGQVICCEKEGADYLPFEFLYEGPTSSRLKTSTNKRHRDVIYYQES